MKLYLVQHGEARAVEQDPERPLSEQGRADVERLAALVRRVGIRVERVMHSGKLRALETAQILAVAMAPGVELERSGMLNPDDNVRAFDWQSESWGGDMLIVGHLPFMARLVSHLLCGDENRLLSAFRPGSMACLEHQGGHWQLDWLVRPELLG